MNKLLSSIMLMAFIDLLSLSSALALTQPTASSGKCRLVLQNLAPEQRALSRLESSIDANLIGSKRSNLDRFEAQIYAQYAKLVSLLTDPKKIHNAKEAVRSHISNLEAEYAIFYKRQKANILAAKSTVQSLERACGVGE